MTIPAFTSSFISGFSHPRVSSNTPRCRMGDSIAPTISIKDTKFEGTSKVSVVWKTIPPNVSEAIAVEGNTALRIALRSKMNPKTLPAPVNSCPPGTAPADFYYPVSTRNVAPVIEFIGEEGIVVKYKPIESIVGGESSNKPESVAFWKAPNYKYSGPEDAAAPVQQEIISTEKFEGYFPSNVRNFAPEISMKRPKGDWDLSAYVQVSSEFISLNSDLAAKLSVDVPDTEPKPTAAAAVSNYYQGKIKDMAPDIEISEVGTPRVVLSMTGVQPEEEEVRNIMNLKGAAASE